MNPVDKSTLITKNTRFLLTTNEFLLKYEAVNLV